MSKRLTGEAGIIVTYLLLLIVAGVLVAFGWRQVQADPPDRVYFLAGIGCAIFSIGLLPIALALANPRRASGSAHRDHEMLRAQSELLRQIHEHTMLSDAAKRIAYRRKEREMLRHAIEEDIAHEDWDAAMVLVDDMAHRFGYRDEAEEFREVIRQRRADVMTRRLDEGLRHFEDVLATRRWSEAYGEVARLRRLFPEARQVQDLDARVRERWEDHKHELERRFLDAASRADVTQAMELLKELDAYLTGREAEPYREVARGIISKARDNLGLRFKLAVQDRDWATAVRVGEQIINDFPNTQMAREVREHIDRLRMLAAQAMHATAAGQVAPAGIPNPGPTTPGASPSLSGGWRGPGGVGGALAGSGAGGVPRGPHQASGDIEVALRSLEAAYGEHRHPAAPQAPVSPGSGAVPRPHPRSAAPDGNSGG